MKIPSLLTINCIVCHTACEKEKYDKELSTRIQSELKTDDELKDDTAGWHVVCGKSFASAITYQTEWVLFFDLLEANNYKTFLMFKTT